MVVQRTSARSADSCQARPACILCTGRPNEDFDADPENGSREEADSAVVDDVDRRGRFDLREGHDLKRLIWREKGSGDSTGLLMTQSVTRQAHGDDWNHLTGGAASRQARVLSNEV